LKPNSNVNSFSRFNWIGLLRISLSCADTLKIVLPFSSVQPSDASKSEIIVAAVDADA
jgi:hypothetical protein